MPIGVLYSNIYPHTDVKNIPFVCKNCRRTANPPPTIAIAAINPSIGCIDALNKRVLADLFTRVSSDGGLVDTSRISTIVVG